MFGFSVAGKSVAGKMARFGLAALLAGAGAGLIGTGGPTALASAPASPAGREWASFSYDPAQSQVVLFGGDNGSKALGDTWIHVHRGWVRQHPAHSPSPRTGAAMVYDGATGQLLLFGGSKLIGTGGGFLGDTWIWTGRDWRRLHPATSPPARHNADVIYDAATQNVVLFGGYDGRYLGDTWTWDGATWTEQHSMPLGTTPLPRDTGSFVYDAATGTGVLYGGFDGTQAFVDTWTWNGTWTRQTPATSPADPTYAWMAAYDAVTQQVLLFGEDDGQTWAWNGVTWTRQFPDTSPPPRGIGSMTDDTATDRVLLFGGAAFFGRPATARGLWSWDGVDWARNN